MRLTLWRWPLWRWTVSHQVLILVAVSILAAQAAGLIVALTLPQRPLAGLTIDQVSDRIKDAVSHVSVAEGQEAAREARSLSDRRLVFSVVDQAPSLLQDPIAARAAEALGMPEDSVRVDFGPGPRRGRRGPGPGGFGQGLPRQTADFQPTSGAAPQPGFPPEAFSGPPSGAGPRPRLASINQRLDRAIDQSRPPGVFIPRGGRQFRAQGFPLFPRARLLIKAGDHWLMVRGGPGLGEDWWLRQVILTFALTLAALLLPALWIGYRLARRIGAWRGPTSCARRPAPSTACRRASSGWSRIGP